MSRVKIILFNLHYSPNLGDGLIGACMVHALGRALPGARIVPIDISGRSGFGNVVVRNRALALRVLRWLPPGLRQAIVFRRLNTLLDRIVPHWEAELQGADIAILGGGQLFADSDLNFPTKVARVARLVREANVPIAVHAVGVTQNWSHRGTRLFRRLAAADLRHVGLRDEPSMSAWMHQFGAIGPVPALARDPGLLAAETFGPKKAIDRVALGITAPGLLNYHADGGVAGGGGIDFFAATAQELLDRGHKLRLFSNGADEDIAALGQLVKREHIVDAMDAGLIEVAPNPRTPEDLVATVAPCKGVVSHRLHSSILAYSYKRAVVGLGWDSKVQSFFSAVGLDDQFLGRSRTSPEDVAQALARALASGVDPERHAAAVTEARSALDTTVAALMAPVAEYEG